MLVWFILLGMTFAIWTGVMGWMLVQLNNHASARRKHLFDIGQTFRSFGALLRDPQFSAQRRAVISATLALFMLIFSRPFFLG